jgi:NAD(P)-dependent dehydrogenase (short-subunit alcohol dehydrogenase family)
MDPTSDVQKGAARVALVTGAGSGIGRACAIRLAADGFAVVANDISSEALEETRRLLVARGGQPVVEVGDVGEPTVLEAMAEQAIRQFGRIDALINNAGYGRPGSVRSTDDELLDEMMHVNVKGVLHGMRAVLPIMAAQKQGSIVNVASMAALGAATDRAAYGAAKSAVVALTRSAAAENGRHGIRVNAVCPGPVHTPALERFVPDYSFYTDQLPMRRLARAEEVAAVVAFLVGPDSSYVSGAALPVDGAMGARLPSPVLTPDDLTA